MSELNIKKELKEANKLSISDFIEFTNQMLISESLSRYPSDIEYRRSMLKRLKAVLTLEKSRTHHHIKVILDESYDTKRPKLYTCTTGGANDLLTIFSLLKEPAWLPVIRPEYAKDYETYLYRRHFVTWYDSTNDDMKEILFNRQIKLLQSGANIICFPEVSPCTNLTTISELNNDYYDLVTKTNAIIIPIGIVEIKKEDTIKSYVTIGRNFDLSGIRIDRHEDLITLISSELVRLKKQSSESVKLTDKDTYETTSSKRHLLIKKR